VTAEQLEKIVHVKPFRPYRLVLTDGEQILVNRPRKSHVSGDVVSLLGQVCRKESAAAIEKFRIVKVDDVVAAEHVDVPIKET
jgi:hypothetical protein